MSRKPRIHRPAAFYHVMLRGNNGQEIFFSDRDRCRICLLIQEGLERFDHRIHGFCLMSNHIHLVIQVGTVSLSCLMHHLASAYSRYINQTQGRIGHLFQARFKAILVDADNYLSELVRYVHLNPVRAGIVDRPENYTWSGHKAYIGLIDIPWLSQEWVLKKFHQSDIPARVLYEEYVKRGIGEKARSEFFSGSHQGRLLGDDNFVERVIEETQSNSANSKLSVIDLMNIIAAVINIPLSSMQSRAKRSQIAQARGIAALLVRQTPHLSLRELAKILEKDSDALSRLATVTENRIKTDSQLAEIIEQTRTKISQFCA